MNSPLHRANKPDLLLFIAAFVDCLCGVSNLSSSSISYFIPILVLSFFGVAYIVRDQLQESAEQQVLENSRVMMETARASRSYTTKQIAPLVDHEQSKIDKANNNVFQILDMQLPAALQKAIDSIPHPKDKQIVENVRQQILDSVRQAPRDLPGTEFFPQSIPFYASTENFKADMAHSTIELLERFDLVGLVSHFQRARWNSPFCASMVRAELPGTLRSTSAVTATSYARR